MSSFSIVVLTYRPGSKWQEWLDAYSRQVIKPRKAVLIDSSSEDGTVELARKFGFEVHVIRPEDFDHGSTRQLGVELSGDSEIVFFLTQDAVLVAPDSFEKLLEPFVDSGIAAAYGRQLPQADATPIAAHARMFNYPPISRIKSRRDVTELGIKTVFSSNAFAAYRRRALMQVGGFPTGTIFAEDQIVAARMLLQGMTLAYVAGAQVRHSHNYTILDEFRRYFDIGVFHSRESWMLKQFGYAGGEGARFVRSELSYLQREAPAQIPSALLRTVLKLVAYRLGALERALPVNVKKRLSMHPRFWDTPSN